MRLFDVKPTAIIASLAAVYLAALAAFFLFYSPAPAVPSPRGSSRRRD
jgi:hypothetical protein